MLPALEAGSRPRWIAAVKVGSFVGAGLQQKDVAEPPSAQYAIRDAAAIRHELASATERQLVYSRREPAVLARAPYRTVFGLAVVEVHGARTGVLIGKMVGDRPLIVRHVLGEGVGRFEGVAVLEQVGVFRLEGGLIHVGAYVAVMV